MFPNSQSTPSFEGHHGRGQELLRGAQNRRYRVLVGAGNVEYCENNTPDIAAEAARDQLAAQDELAARRARTEQAASPAAFALEAAVETPESEAARQALIAAEMQEPNMLTEPEVPIDNVLHVDFLSKARQEVEQAQQQQMMYGDESDAAAA